MPTFIKIQLTNRVLTNIIQSSSGSENNSAIERNIHLLNTVEDMMTHKIRSVLSIQKTYIKKVKEGRLY